MEKSKLNFTKAALDAVPVPSKGRRTRVFDSKSRGLLLEVTSTGSRVFWLRRKIEGRSNWERIGPYPDLTIELARKRADEINCSIALGNSPFEAHREWEEELTLGQLFQEYLNRHARKKRKTADIMEKDFHRNLGHWRERKLSTITNHDAEKLHGYLGRSRGIYSANRTIQLLRAIYNKGRLWKLFMKDNPATGISLFPETPRERYLSQQEVKRLLHALFGEGDSTIRDFVLLAMLTGARKSNLLSMRWDDIDPDVPSWTIRETKNNKSQTIALTATEIALLQNRRQFIRGEFVFPGTGKTGHWKDPKKAWARLLASAGITNCTVHDLRRNLASWMASKNVNVALIQSALNHKDLKTTLTVYGHTANEAEREGRQVAHSAMFDAAGIIVPFRITKQEEA